MKPLTALACAALALPAAWSATAQPTAAPTGASTGVYSKAQAARGAAVYEAQCARCHGGALEGIDVAPPLTGGRFLANWTHQPVAALASRIRTTMPLDGPGVLGLSETADVTAYILQSNGYPAGAADMPSGSQQLLALTIDTPPGK